MECRRMADFKYQDMFPVTEDTTEYRLLTEDHVNTTAFDGTEVLKVSVEGLTLLAEQAFNEVSHLLRPSHLKLLAGILMIRKVQPMIVMWPLNC